MGAVAHLGLITEVQYQLGSVSPGTQGQKWSFYLGLQERLRSWGSHQHFQDGRRNSYSKSDAQRRSVVAQKAKGWRGGCAFKRTAPVLGSSGAFQRAFLIYMVVQRLSNVVFYKTRRGSTIPAEVYFCKTAHATAALVLFYPIRLSYAPSPPPSQVHKRSRSEMKLRSRGCRTRTLQRITRRLSFCMAAAQEITRGMSELHVFFVAAIQFAHL